MRAWAHTFLSFFTGAVVIVDSVNNLASADPSSPATFLPTIVTPAVSAVCVYHTDVPVVAPRAAIHDYEPSPLTVLCHLATAVLRVSSLPQELQRQRARGRAQQEPEWGLGEDSEGTVIGLRPRGKDGEDGGVVVDLESRRRSGRAVREKFVMMPAEAAGPGQLSLLADHAAFRTPPADSAAAADDDGADLPESTFDLGLTDKQRRDRDGIVLPYFDAQTDIGAGEGGRILYDMGREDMDDFDDEEDEI